jgi:uncharacterized protein YneR
MEDFNHLNEEEKLKAENDFLKMKIMLENGGVFGGDENNELPAEMENVFLNNIVAFEKQFKENKTIKVFDKIGRPNHFKPVSEIPDDEMDNAWTELSNHLNEHDIDLGVCSPNITARELYRFTTEELFEHETGDMNVPGWTTNFIYDEFHPDPVYENSRQVEQNLLHDIFCKRDLFYEIDYDKAGFVFNKKLYEDREAFIKMINRFKSLFDEIEVTEYTTVSCDVKDTDCVVKGNYVALAKNGNNSIVYKGDFKVELSLNDMDYWYFKNIQIDGFNPT